MKDYEQQDCQLFNTGRFNDIVYAYFVMAARKAIQRWRKITPF